MIYAIPSILPTLVLIVVVLGSIYVGIATPTEAAALGVAIAIIIALCYKRLNWGVIRESGFGAIKTTAMITLIIVCAQMMSMSMSMLRTPSMLAEIVASLRIDRWYVMMVICLLYIGLGCVLEALSMFLLTIPVVYPIVLALNFDPIWFGVVLTIIIEMAQITPPVGINIFIIQGVSGGRNIADVAVGIVPFFFCQVVLLIMVCIFPELATWLPSQMIENF
jgi:tripartite ATP-independent transporter DctM subunit